MAMGPFPPVPRDDLERHGQTVNAQRTGPQALSHNLASLASWGQMGCHSIEESSKRVNNSGFEAPKRWVRSDLELGKEVFGPTLASKHWQHGAQLNIQRFEHVGAGILWYKGTQCTKSIQICHALWDKWYVYR